MSCKEPSDFLSNLQPILALNNSTGKIVLVGYSQTLRSLYINYPGTLSALGPNSTIIDLGELRSEVNTPSEGHTDHGDPGSKHGLFSQSWNRMAERSDSS